MSLRAFHILLILATLACFGFLAVWAGQRASQGLAAASGACFLSAAAYLTWFIRKTKSPGA
ncbi:MAG: hypothetical protein HY078_10860 [Elusimicrobia bacterium]|nr:hypothetical protein [Elusimicrobiota bacterium]